MAMRYAKYLWWSLCAESKAVVSTFTWVRLKLRILLGHSEIKFAVPKFSWKKKCQVIRLSFGSRRSTRIQLFPYRKYRIDSTIVTATVLHNRIGIYFYFSRSSADPSNNKAARISASHDGGHLSTRKPWLYFCQLANSESCTHAHSPLGFRVPGILNNIQQSHQNVYSSYHQAHYRRRLRCVFLTRHLLGPILVSRGRD